MRNIFHFLFLFVPFLVHEQDDTANIQQQPKVTFGGLLFGDVYHIPNHHLAIDQKSFTGAVLRRGYLTFNIQHQQWFGRLRGELNQDGAFETYSFTANLKDFYVGYKAGNHKLVLGLQPSLTFNVIEDHWGLRYLARTPMDMQGIASREFGISATGPLGQSDKWKYRMMVGDGIYGLNHETGDGNKWMAAVSFLPNKKLFLDFYADYERLPGEIDRSMLQFFGGYKSQDFRAGFQYSYQNRQSDPVLQIFSIYAVTTVWEQTKAIARIDRVIKPSPKGNNISYIPFDPSSPATLLIVAYELPIKQHFYITPNVLLTTYDKLSNSIKPSNDLYLRLTFFVNFE